MAIQKRLKKVWTGVAWVEVYNPTSSDLIDHKGTDLETVIDGLESDLSTHASNSTLHKTSGDISKLGNLAADANATYASKTELGTHASDTALHTTTGDKSKLSKLANDPDATYATKAELTKSKTYVYADISEMEGDLTNFTSAEVGAQALVKDPSADTDNIPHGFEGVAYYMLQEDVGGLYWDFTYKLGGTEISIEWSEINGKPSSSAAAIDDAVSKVHVHANKTVIDKLSDVSGELMYDSKRIGSLDNHIFLQDDEPGTEIPTPSEVRKGDLWFAPVE